MSLFARGKRPSAGAGKWRFFAVAGDEFRECHSLREYGLNDTPLAKARCDTIRLKLLKVGAVVRVTVRRGWFSRWSSLPVTVAPA